MTKTGYILSLCILITLSAGAQSLPAGNLRVEAKRWNRQNQNMPWQWYQTLVVDSLKAFTQQTDATNSYGSKTGQQVKATGFYRTEKIQNRWWIVDPDGFLNIQRAVNALHPGGSDNNKEAFNARFGDTKKWMQETAADLHKFGFNAIGSWSDHEVVLASNKTRQSKLACSIILNFMSSYGRKRGGTYQLPGNTGYPNQCIFVFDPEFAVFCDEAASKLADNRCDKNIFGYFSDNELPFGMKNLEGYLTLADSLDPGRKYAEHWIKQQGISREQITDQHRSRFAGVVAEEYHRIVAQAIRKYDPNHLYLGSRLHGAAKNIEPIVRAAGKYCDIVSINYYGDWTPDPVAMTNWGEWAGKPFMITEFYTKGNDVGLANTTGAGFTVRTQTDRAYAYQHFCLGLLASRNCVGWHWFKYQDNDPEAKNVDPSNIDSNKGMLNSRYQWHQPLVEKMTQLNTQVYAIIDYIDKNHQTNNSLTEKK